MKAGATNRYGAMTVPKLRCGLLTAVWFVGSGRSEAWRPPTWQRRMPLSSSGEPLVGVFDGLVERLLGGLLTLHGQGDLLLEVLVAVGVGESAGREE